MNRTIQALRGVFIFGVLTSVATSAHAWNADSDQHYLALPSNYQQPVSRQPVSADPSVVVYSPDEYPTAQGRYLTLPPGYQQAPPPAPVPPVYRPAAAPVQYQYQAPPPAPPVVQSSQPANPPVVAAQPQYQAPTPATLDQLPSFPYERRLDPRYVPKPPPPELPDDAPDKVTLGTQTGGEAGLQISDYRYQEFGVSGDRVMRITGANFGATLGGNKAFASGWFYGGDFRLAIGSHNYTGGDIDLFSQMITPSTHDGVLDILAEARVVGGHDFVVHGAFWNAFNFGFSPYIGLGFRYLYDDAKGDDSNGVPGYERFSHYLYLPVGLTPRFRLTQKLRVSMNMEYDQLLYGWQVSSLNEAIPGATEITDTQSRGYGLRGSMMLEWPIFSIGPFFNFWDIGQSTTDCGGGLCGDEPHNQTFEFGLQSRYRF